ncbi:type IV pilus modification PilV family protein [Trinickia dabaoshanensis]|nr:hypothetical protein [Trinickia dabaoshanensis]
MSPIHTHGRGCAGASLLEVLVAVSLLAVSLLGIAAAQLASLGDVETQTRRAHASWLAASTAETVRLRAGSSSLLEHSRARAQAVIPGGQVDVVDEAHEVGAVLVHWPGRVELGRSGLRSPCAVGADPALTHCIALPFAGRK